MERIIELVLGVALLALSTMLWKLQLVNGIGIQVDGLDYFEWCVGWGIRIGVLVAGPIIGVSLICKDTNSKNERSLK